jgi:hypothetical protein
MTFDSSPDMIPDDTFNMTSDMTPNKIFDMIFNMTADITSNMKSNISPIHDT